MTVPPRPPGRFAPQRRAAPIERDPQANLAAAAALAAQSHPQAATMTGGAHLPGAPIAPPPRDVPAQLPVYPANGVDCSPAAQARRWEQLQDLEARLASGIASTSDRNRQVAFTKPEDMARQIAALRAQLAYCQTGQWPTNRNTRVLYPPQVKAL